jgi:hypothetical protein
MFHLQGSEQVLMNVKFEAFTVNKCINILLGTQLYQCTVKNQEAEEIRK